MDRAAFDALGPWTTQWNVGGKTLGGSFDAPHDVRLTQFFAAFSPVGRVLELGPLEGGHTFALASKAKHVDALEGREENLNRCRFMQKTLGVGNVEFHRADLESVELSFYGRFDAVFCVGVLYHLPNPWRLLRQCAAVSDRLFLWTHYATPDAPDMTGRLYREHGMDDRLSGLSDWSFWPTKTCLMGLLKDAGWNRITLIKDDLDFPAGSTVTMAAWKE